MIGEKMKYIVFGKKFAIIFNSIIVHSDVRVGSYPGKPTSAGFVTLVPVETRHNGYINATVHGESVSLNLKSNGVKDERIIEDSLNEL